ncbi:MAG: hypothetical protein QOI11_2366 [Candidatus Eremiobacteraeota bacterium]|jgi:hypothetical protein|nr:hypothetical protein [Candidatus Eremiobacteraeota bacterium]
MLTRLAAVLALCAGLAACNQNDVPVATSLFQGLGDVKVLDARLVPSGDNSAATGAGTLGYVIARIEFTNDLGIDTTPRISNFVLEDRAGTRYQAHDSGSSVFTGISNSQQVLKKDEKRVYTVGFRTSDPNISGSIYYDKTNP